MLCDAAVIGRSPHRAESAHGLEFALKHSFITRSPSRNLSCDCRLLRRIHTTFFVTPISQFVRRRRRRVRRGLPVHGKNAARWQSVAARPLRIDQPSPQNFSTMIQSRFFSRERSRSRSAQRRISCASPMGDWSRSAGTRRHQRCKFANAYVAGPAWASVWRARLRSGFSRTAAHRNRFPDRSLCAHCTVAKSATEILHAAERLFDRSRPRRKTRT
jgi:hypothetical protein